MVVVVVPELDPMLQAAASTPTGNQGRTGSHPTERSSAAGPRSRCCGGHVTPPGFWLMLLVGSIYLFELRVGRPNGLNDRVLSVTIIAFAAIAGEHSRCVAAVPC